MKKLIQNILLITSIILISGCDNTNLRLPTNEPIIDENLPVIDHANVKIMPDMAAMALEWKATPTQDVIGYYIYRSELLKDGQSLVKIATINNKYTSHYLDDNLLPDTKYLYAFSSINQHGHESQASIPVLANTSPRFSSVSFLTAVNELPRQIKVLWRPHSNQRVQEYIIQRSNTDSAKWKNIKTIDSRLKVEHIDKGLADDAFFSYRIVSVTFDGIKSKPSDIVKARTKVLPLNITNLTATLEEPKKITLTWDILEDISDVAYYNIHAASSEGGYFHQIVKAKANTNTYEHAIQEDGLIKFYKITTVDKDKLESLKPKDAAIGRTLDSPASPVITLAQIQNDTVILNWESSDDRAVSFNIYKSINTGYFSKDTTKIDTVKTKRFEDKDIVRGVTYDYSFEAIDKFGLVSKRTPPTSLSITKLAKIPTQEETPNATSTSN